MTLEDQARMKRIDRAALKVLFHVPFFAAGVSKLPVTFDDSIPTACTNGNGIRWSRAFLDKLKDEEIVTVYCHEVCHCLLGHLWRAPQGCDWGLWNQATDHAVNNMLKEFGAQVQTTRKANPFPFPEPQDAYCANPAFAGMAEEKIYSILASQPKTPGGSGSKTGSGQPQPGASKPQPGSMPSFGQMDKPQTSSEEQGKQKTEWQNTLLQSASAHKQRGELPGMFARLVEDLIDPKIPWQDMLRSLLREQINDDWDFMRPNKYFEDSDFILPSLHSERIGEIIVGIDTSGSIDTELLKQFKGAMQEALEELKPRVMHEICCDTRVTAEREYHVGDTIAKEAPGGGGTRLEKIFERIEERELAPKAIVILTDLETSFPKQIPEYPVIWCNWGDSNKTAPFGTILQVR